MTYGLFMGGGRNNTKMANIGSKRKEIANSVVVSLVNLLSWFMLFLSVPVVPVIHNYPMNQQQTAAV